MLAFKPGEIVEGNFNKKFIVRKVFSTPLCKSCVFSKEYNPDFDSRTSCDDRRKAWIKNLKSDLCSYVLPSKCVFTELTGGV